MLSGDFIFAFFTLPLQVALFIPSPDMHVYILILHCRKELIAQYSRLSEEAARRERRAMWRVQRMRLDEARAHFFMFDRQKIQVRDEHAHKRLMYLDS